MPLISPTHLIVGTILLTSVPGCSGCQQQTSVETTSTEDAATESFDSDREIPDTTVEVGGNATEIEQTTAVSNKSVLNVGTVSNSSQGIEERGTADSNGESDMSKAGSSSSVMSASQALARAEDLFTLARADNLHPSQSFQHASQAWQLLNQHPDNVECQAMAAEIAQSLKAMAAKANGKYITELSGDPVLIEK